MRFFKLLLSLSLPVLAVSIQSGVSLPNPLLSVGDLVVGTTNGAQTNLAAGASGTFLGSNGIGIAPTYQLINYSSLTGTVPTWNQSTTGTAANVTATSNSTLTTLSALSLPIGQVTGTINATQVNGAAVPASATIVGTNSSRQIVDASAATLANNTTGSAASLTTTRTFSATGDATATAQNFNGSANVALPMVLATVNASPGTYGDASHVAQVTVNGKGLAPTVASVAITPAAIGAQPALSGGVSNALPKWTGASTLGNSSLSDNGTTVSTSEPIQSSYPGSFTNTFGLSSSGSAPGLELNNTSAGTNSKIWDLYSDGSGNLQLLATQDSRGGGGTVLTIARSGAGPGTMTVQGPFNVNNTATVNGLTVSTLTGILIGSSGVVSATTTLPYQSTISIPHTQINDWSSATSGFLTSSTGVTSFNGRTGAVTPSSSDYSSFYLPINNPTFTATLTGPTAVFGASDVMAADWAGSTGIGWIGQSSAYNSGSGTNSAGILFNGGLTAIEASEIGRASCRERVCQYV